MALRIPNRPPRPPSRSPRINSQAFVLHVREHDRGRAGAFPMETPQDDLELMSDTVKTLRAAAVTATGEVHGEVAGYAAKNIVDTAKT
jgi:hypothetical protein